jgi:TolB protein
VAVNAGYTSYDAELGRNDMVTRHYDPIPSPSKPTIVSEDSLMGGAASYNYYYRLASEALRRNVGFLSINWNHYRQQEVTPPLNQLAAIRDAAVDLGILEPGAAAKRKTGSAGGRIVFHSDRDGDYEIYTMLPDGSDVRQLTRNSHPDYAPQYSPDGTRIVFFSQRDGNDEVYVMDAGGKHQRRLTDNSAADLNPCWSPDGREILFDSNRTGPFELHLIKADGTGLRQITRGDGEDSMLADWSPDGKLIACSINNRNRKWAWNVFLRDVTGGAPRQITPGAGSCRPAWSPDGRMIAYVARHRENNHDIWLMDANGDNRRRLPIEAPGRDYDPAWSPDGSHIVFASEPYDGKGSRDIYVFHRKSGMLDRLTDDEWNNAYPHWGMPAGDGGC